MLHSHLAFTLLWKTKNQNETATVSHMRKSFEVRMFNLNQVAELLRTELSLIPKLGERYGRPQSTEQGSSEGRSANFPSSESA